MAKNKNKKVIQPEVKEEEIEETKEIIKPIVYPSYQQKPEVKKEPKVVVDMAYQD